MQPFKRIFEELQNSMIISFLQLTPKSINLLTNQYLLLIYFCDSPNLIIKINLSQTNYNLKIEENLLIELYPVL